MSTIIALNVGLAAIVLTTIVGLLVISIATAPSDRGVTLVRRSRLRFERAQARPSRGEVTRAWPAI